MKYFFGIGENLMSQLASDVKLTQPRFIWGSLNWEITLIGLAMDKLVVYILIADWYMRAYSSMGFVIPSHGVQGLHKKASWREAREQEASDQYSALVFASVTAWAYVLN